MNERYYIGTGAKNCYYTLRFSFQEFGKRSTGDGQQPEIFVVERDYHMRNLSTNREEAIAKAREITGAALDASFEVQEISKRESIDWSILQGGKHEGTSIHELRESEEGKNYLLWLAENCKTSSRYAKTVEMLESLLANELAGRATERQQAADAKQVEADRIARVLEPIAAVLVRGNGEFCQCIAQDMRSGILPRGRAEAIVRDIFAKAHGRRNSKSYNAAYDQASEMLAEASGEETPAPFDPMPTVTNTAALDAWNERQGNKCA